MLFLDDTTGNMATNEPYGTKTLHFYTIYQIILKALIDTKCKGQYYMLVEFCILAGNRERVN